MQRFAARMLFVLSLITIAAVRPSIGAESTTGTVLGSVAAENGQPIAGARVSAASPSGQYTVSTDGRGRFVILGITPDTYVVSVQAARFEPVSQAGITVLPGQSQSLAFRLVPLLKTIASVQANARAFSVGTTSDAFTVSANAARGVSPIPVSSSGLANYTAGTVQGAISAVPGVILDPFANAILRGGKVDDAVFDFDSVPIPQGLIAEPGGNVVGAQLPTTGIASTTVTLAGYEAQGSNALGGVIDQIPAIGTYPGSTTLEFADGIAGPKVQSANLEILAATSDQRWRYALASTVDNEYFAYGDGRTFYPSEAATYGLALESRAQYAIEGNVHYALTKKDDVSFLGFAGQGVYNQYGTPYTGQKIGGFDGAQIKYPGESNPDAPVTFASGIRGTFDVLKAAWLHTSGHALSRVQLYQSRFGASAGGPYWDENGFPNGTFSFQGDQSGHEEGLVYDGEDLLGDRHHLKFGAEYQIDTYVLDQVVPTFDEVVRSNPLLHSYLLYVGDTWSVSRRFEMMGAARLTGTHIAPSTGFPYSVSAIDPHLAASYRIGDRYALRATYDHTTVPPKPLEADRYDSNNVDQNGNPAPFVTLNPETANEITYSVEGTGSTQFRLTYYGEFEKNRIDVLPFNFRQAIAGQVLPSPIGVPTNIGLLRAQGLELYVKHGGLAFNAGYIRASSSSASEFAYNDLNAPAIAAGHLFPLGYIPDFTATLSYEFDTAQRHLRIVPSLSYESGYPYGVGTMAWIFDPVTKKPVQVRNDNYVDPGANYYFLRDPSKPFDPLANPYIGSLGTPDGSDPNTLRSPPQTLVNLHLEGDLTPRLTAIVDVANLFAHYAPTEYQTNPYLIGPPGYAGGNSAYAAYYQSVLGSARPYTLGNGVPTNDGVTQSVPWTYGRQAYVPQSYPMGLAVQLRLRYRI